MEDMEEKYLTEFKPITLENAKLIARGGTGECYRIDEDKIVKLYYQDFPEDQIIEEKYCSRLALVSGIPTAISYDMVQCGNRKGVAYEMIGAKTVAEIMRDDPGRAEEMGIRTAQVAKLMHSAEGDKSRLISATYPVRYALEKNTIFPASVVEGATAFMDELDRYDSFVHGDFQVNNIMIDGEESILIDMGGFGKGCPMFDLATMYFCMTDSPEAQEGGVSKFTGLPVSLHKVYWNALVREYFGCADPEEAMKTLPEARLMEKILLLKEIFFVILFGSRYPGKYTDRILAKAIAEYGK